MRRYTTQVHPLIKERLYVHQVLDNDISSLSSTSSYHYIPTNQGFRGSHLMNYIFQSMFDHEEPDFDSIIYALASRKTLEQDNSEEKIIDAAIHQQILYLNGGQVFQPVPLRELSIDQLGLKITVDLLDNDVVNSSLGVAC